MRFEYNNGEPGRPVYTNEEAQRIAQAAWNCRAYLPHPDDVRKEWGDDIREFQCAVLAIAIEKKRKKRLCGPSNKQVISQQVLSKISLP